MPSPNSISGAYLKVTIDGVEIADVMEWTVEEEVEELDRTSGTSAGYGDRDAGVKDATITMTIYQNALSGIYADVSAGTVLTDLLPYRNLNDGSPAFNFPLALVTRSGNPVKVRGGGMQVSVTAKNKGTYTKNDPGA
jgi:hypothetical protein